MDLITQNDTELTTFNTDALERAFSFAEKLSKSGIIPDALRGKPADIMVILQTGIELGLKPMQSLNSINVIRGNPTMNGRTMLAMIRSKVPSALIKIDRVDANRVECTMGRDKQFPDDSFKSVWTIERAKLMGITGKDNWRKQPTNMLTWRAVSEAARFVFPDVLMNVYLPEEAVDGTVDEPEFDKEKFSKSIRDIRNTIAEPDDVKSHTSIDDIAEAQVISSGSSQEALEEAQLISLIPNRDFIFPLGGFKGKKLCEVDIVELRKYFQIIKESSEKTSKKLSESQIILLSNLSTYVKEYDTLESLPAHQIELKSLTRESAQEDKKSPSNPQGEIYERRAVEGHQEATRKEIKSVKDVSFKVGQ